MSTPITEQEKTQYDLIVDASRNGDLAALRVELDGAERVALCDIRQTDDDEYTVVPLAVLLDDDTITRITRPEGATEGGDTK